MINALRISLYSLLLTCAVAWSDRPLPPHALGRVGGEGIWHPGGQGVLLIDSGRKVLTFPGQRGVKGTKVRTWQVEGAREVEGPKLEAAKNLRDIMLSPDGRSILGFSHASSWLIRVDIQTGKETMKLNVARQVGRANDLSISADGKLIACSGHKGAVLVDAEAGKVARELGVTGSCIALSPDGKRVALSPGQWSKDKYGGRALIFDATSGQEIARTQDKFGKYFSELFYSVDGSQLVGRSYGRSPTITVFDGKTAQVDGTIEPTREIRGLALQGDTLVVILLRGMEIWSLSRREKVCEVASAASGRYGLSLSLDGKRLATMASSGNVDVHDTATGKSVLPKGATVLGLFDAVVQDSPRGVIWTSDKAGRVQRWVSGSEGYELDRDVLQCNNLARLALHPGGKDLVVIEPEKVWLIVAETSQRKVTYSAEALNAPSILFMNATSQGRSVTAMTREQAVATMDLLAGKVTNLLEAQTPIVANDESGVYLYRVDVSDDQQWALLAAVRYSALLHIPTGGTSLLDVPRMDCHEFSPLSDLFVTLDRGFLRVWEVDSGREVSKIPNTTGFVDAITFLQPGRILAVADIAGGIHLIDTLAAQRVGFLQGHGVWPEPDKNYQAYRNSASSRRIACLYHAPDSGQLLSGGYEGRAFLWDVSKIEPIEMNLGQVPLDALWEALADENPAKGYPAVLEMAKREGATAFLSGKLQAAGAIDADKVAQLAKQMSDAKYSVRKQAYQELQDLGAPAGPALRRALEAGGFSAEARQRIEALLESWSQATDLGGLETRRALRVLERIATAEATAEIRRLAEGNSPSLLTLSARAALKRLEDAGRLPALSDQ